MEKLIEFRNMNFAYDSKNAFNDFNMEILRGDIVTMIGPASSGKTTLLKMLVHMLPNDSVYYKGIPIKSCNIDEIRNNVIAVFDTPIKSKVVIDELKRYLHLLGINDGEIDERLYELDKAFGINRIINTPIKDLEKEEVALIKLLRYLIIKPAFMALDNALSLLSDSDVKKFFEFVHKNQITVLNVTTDLNQSLYGNKLFILENFVLILEGSTLSVLKTDTLLKRLGFKLPLAVELSIELGHYDVLNKIYTEKEKLVNTLWK